MNLQPNSVNAPRMQYDLDQPRANQGQLVTMTQAPGFRTLLRVSQELIRQGKDGRLALNRLRPCIDGPNQQIAANATLQKEEWKLFDDTVIQGARERLVAVADLLNAGLRLNIANPFGTTVIEQEQVSEMTEASVAMYAGTPPTDDRVAYTLVGVPVPIVSKGFWLDERVLEASRMRGQTLDTTNADAATRVVAEKLEFLLFFGGVSYGGYTLSGYTNAPGVNTGSLTGSWLTLSNTAPDAILNDVIRMKQALTSDLNQGPYILYVPLAWSDALDNDYFATAGSPPTGSVAPTRSIRERLMVLEGINAIRTTSQLTTGAVLVNMTRNVVDVGFGFEPRLIQWESQGGLVNHFRVISIMTFRIKTDYAGRSGVAYFT